MPDQQLIQYIVEQERAGFSPEQIRATLIGQGYTPAMVEAAFAALGPASMDPLVHEYVQQYARQGYSAVQTFLVLTQQGHSPKTVRKAINDVYGQVMPEHHASILVFIVLAVLVAGGGVFFMTRAPSEAIEPTPVYNPPVGAVTLSPSEQIANIVTIAQKQGKDPAVQECQRTLDGEDFDFCLESVAKTVDDDTLCDKIQRAEPKDRCLMSFASKRFESVCQRVQLKSSIQSCETIKALRQNSKKTV